MGAKKYISPILISSTRQRSPSSVRFKSPLRSEADVLYMKKVVVVTGLNSNLLTHEQSMMGTNLGNE